MSIRWIMFFFAVFVTANLFASLYQSTIPDMSVINSMKDTTVTSTGDWLGYLQTYIPGMSLIVPFVSNLYKIIWFDYPFLNDGMYVWIQWILRAFSVGAIYGIIKIVRGTA